ncbi:Phosphorylase b kinase gamma catalytic chain, skeletal muscle/heart isoform [Xenoophorus captivus]|uniref:Phosphorylase b kinase gamma catalytic chain, skeletal muscle/heart isoform n=1 Tax=Xenoophorus captivus TaxID=1517983 RepID=A0ABV0RFV7_9TELE
MTVLATMRIYCHYRRAKPVTKEVIKSDPYAVKPIRKLIDACAFKIYGHWVKKGQAQNRAALFENSPKAILLKKWEENKSKKPIMNVKCIIVLIPMKLDIAEKKQ